MKIHVISDTHNDHDQLNLPGGDILIHCGDACTKGNYTEAINFIWWFIRQNYKYKVIVAGNHDRKLKSHTECRMLMKQAGIVYLDDEYTEIEGISMYGNNHVNQVKLGQFQNTRATRDAAWSGFDKYADMVITHTPPMNVLDSNLAGESCGDDVLLDKLMEFEPRVLLCGHIHEHGGEVEQIGSTKVYNCANKNRQYLIVRQFTELKEFETN